jgi:hypothetical protein
LSAFVVSHAWHASPPKPHDASDLPLHVGPEQHPVVHVDAHPLHVPFVQVSAPGHVWHCVPPLPHAPTLLPVWQVPLAQQPRGHETPSHWQEPFKQRCPAAHAAPVPHLQAPSVHESAEPAAHAAHTWPAGAHALRDESMHVPPDPPEQHPLGQDVASQTHTSLAQCCPVAQGAFNPHWQTPVAEHELDATASHITHVDPAAPHVAKLRWLHVGPSQQPSQSVGSHSQCPPSQRCPTPHAAPPPHVHVPAEQVSVVAVSHGMHAAPAAPHSLGVVVGWHVFPTQHPVHAPAQVEQTPLSHVSPVGHASHMLPWAPHAVASVPALHVAPSQHPVHELLLQTHAPSTHACPMAHAAPLPHMHVPAALHESVVVASQLVQMHFPATHSCVGEHGAPLPHAFVSV